MGTVTPITLMRAARRGIIIDQSARPYLNNISKELSRDLPYVLLAGTNLGLVDEVHYSEIVYAAKQQGFKLSPPELAIHLAVQGLSFPTILVGMLPCFKDGCGVLLRVSNKDRAVFVDIETYKASHTFSPHVVFAFLRS